MANLNDFFLPIYKKTTNLNRWLIFHYSKTCLSFFRSFSIAERFFLCQSRLVVQQVQFHPGSSLDGHVVVLSSDNYLRIYNADEDRTTPEQSVSLSANINNRDRVVVRDHLSDQRSRFHSVGLGINVDNSHIKVEKLEMNDKLKIYLCTVWGGNLFKRFFNI